MSIKTKVTNVLDYVKSTSGNWVISLIILIAIILIAFFEGVDFVSVILHLIESPEISDGLSEAINSTPILLN